MGLHDKQQARVPEHCLWISLHGWLAAHNPALCGASPLLMPQQALVCTCPSFKAVSNEFLINFKQRKGRLTGKAGWKCQLSQRVLVYMGSEAEGNIFER